MKLYTRHGDDGSTGLFGGERLSKADPRVVANGHVDEANAAIGVAAAQGADEPTVTILRQLQADLFVVGSELASSTRQTAASASGTYDVKQLESWIDAATAEVPPLTQFILPGGTPIAAALHHARTVVRRAERAVVALSQSEPVRPDVLVFLNRLSDLLFALARQSNHRSGVADVPWVSGGP